MGRTGIVAGLDYATTEILLVEDRYDDARLRLGLSSGFGNPATFQRQNPDGTLPGLATSSIPDPLCGSELLGGPLPAGEINTTGTPACQLFNALGRASQPEAERIIGLSTLTHEFTDTMSAQVEVGFAGAALRHPVRVRDSGRNRDPGVRADLQPRRDRDSGDVSDLPASEQWQH